MMSSKEYPSAAAVTVKEEKPDEDEETGEDIPNYEIDVYQKEIKIEYDPVDQNFEAHSSSVTSRQDGEEDVRAMNSEVQFQHWGSNYFPGVPLEEQNIAEVDIHVHDIKTEYPEVALTENPGSSSIQNSASDIACTVPLQRIKRAYRKSNKRRKNSKGNQISSSEELHLICADCGMAFKKKKNLVRHKMVHSGEKSFGCGLCGKLFRTKFTLKTHERIHSGEKPYTCLNCGKAFSEKSKLTRHERIHSGEKPYSCVQCDKMFTVKSHLSEHERIHSGEKPYCCLQCGVAFARKSNLIIHQRIHSGEKPFSCGICGKLFTQKCHLTVHEKVHNVFK